MGNTGITRRAAACIMCVLLSFTFCAPSSAFAVTSTELKAQRAGVVKDLASAQEKLDQASDSYNNALTEQQAAEENLKKTEAEIEDLKNRSSELQEKLASRVVSTYKNDERNMFVELILGSTSLNDMINTWNSYAAMNENAMNNLRASQEIGSTLDMKEAMQSEYSEIATQKAQEAQMIKEAAEADADSLQKKVNELDASIKEQVLKEAQEAASRRAKSITPTGAARGIPANGSVVDYAISRLGCPYVWAASGPNSFDCSGLVMWCYRQIGKSVPHNSESLKASAKAVIAVSEAEPGDVLYRPGHVGICTRSGGGEYIHAPHSGDVVRYSTYGRWSCALRF